MRTLPTYSFAPAAASRKGSPMTHAELERAIEEAWEGRDAVSPETTGATRDAIEATLDALDAGRLRVAERGRTAAGM
jgi:hypothetical protein